MNQQTRAIEVVAGLVQRNGRFLLCRRPMHKARGGQWEFAGGKVEAGETKQQALAREFREELALDLDVGNVIAEVTHRYPDLTVHLSLLEARALNEPQALEHSEFVWEHLAKLPGYDLCPADRELLHLILERSWRQEEAEAHIRGWDFSHIGGRWSEEPLPWDYREIIERRRKPSHQILDVDTGGGEFLLSLNHPPVNTAASEAYPSNAELCRRKLLPLGVDFREGTTDSLPFENERFDLVLNRHGGLNPAEIHRVLKPGGFFITQQVGADNDRELVDLLLPGTPVPFPGQRLHLAEQSFRSAGFLILESAETLRPIHFYDVGALVWFARIIEWEFPGFCVERCLPHLRQAQQILDEKGSIEGRIHRFMLVAQKQ